MFPPRRIPYLPTTHHTASCVQDSQVPSYLPYSHQNMAQFIALLIPLLHSSPALKPSGPGGKSPFTHHLLKHESPLCTAPLEILAGSGCFLPCSSSLVVLPPLDCSPSLFSKTVLTLGRSDCHITPAACCSHLMNGSLVCKDFYSCSIASKIAPIILPVPLSV